MAVRPILTWPDPMLSRPARAPLSVDERLVSDLFDTMYDARGRGLAAPQIGEARRVFVMDVAWKDGPRQPRLFVDPEIIERSEDRVTGPEGCLSIPGISAEITRHAEITLRWRELDGATHEERLTGFAAICAQHEIDHLDGIVTLDRLDEPLRRAALAAYRGDGA